MGLKAHDAERCFNLLRRIVCDPDDRLMALVDTVEVADRNHGSARHWRRIDVATNQPHRIRS